MDLRDYQAYVQADRQIQALESEQARRAGAVENGDAYRFLLSPTCPPSTSVRFQGGLLWWPEYSTYPAGFFVPSYAIDLADTNIVSVPFKFSYAYWYVPALIGVDQDIWPLAEPPPATAPDDTIYFYRSTTEYETAAEAEASVVELRGQIAIANSHNMGGIILRNNGNVLDYNQFMPIDPINRGRSYLFGKKRYGWELA